MSWYFRSRYVLSFETQSHEQEIHKGRFVQQYVAVQLWYSFDVPKRFWESLEPPHS